MNEVGVCFLLYFTGKEFPFKALILFRFPGFSVGLRKVDSSFAATDVRNII